jgi:DNA-binding NarL/FixJ family response regulator
MKKILIIEDEIVIAEDIQNILEKEGYEIAGIAECYDEAIKLFNKNKPDIILRIVKQGLILLKNFLNQELFRLFLLPPIPVMKLLKYLQISTALHTLQNLLLMGSL